MASRRRNSAVTIDAQADGGPADVVRRAPFADNPHVGARGQRTQQRILDAALEVFGEGYDRCSIDSITKRAGCSRAAFYQYFSSKEDRLSPSDGPGGACAQCLDRGTGAVDPRRSGLARPSRVGLPPFGHLRPLRALVPRVSGGVGERRRRRHRLCALGCADRLEDPLQDRRPPRSGPASSIR